MPPIPGNVTGQIFTFDELTEKLKREIARLKQAEEEGNAVDALDYALNAAFTGYHLIEWEEKEANPGSRARTYDLLTQKNDQHLNLLHDIVTRTKHMTVSNSATGGQTINVRTSAAGGETTATLGNTPIADVADYYMESVFVKFENQRARQVLEDVLIHITS